MTEHSAYLMTERARLRLQPNPREGPRRGRRNAPSELAGLKAVEDGRQTSDVVAVSYTHERVARAGPCEASNNTVGELLARGCIDGSMLGHALTKRRQGQRLAGH